MPIVLATARQLTQRCANCTTERVLAVATLMLGEDHDPNQIVLPVCTVCGAQEYLSRTSGVIAERGAATHRRRVNGLGEALKRIGRVHPMHAALYATEQPPEDIEPLG